MKHRLLRSLPLFLLSSCDVGTRLIIEPKWDEGEPAIIIVGEEGERPSLAWLITSNAAHLTFEARAPFTIWARTYSELRDRELTGCRAVLGGDAGELLGEPSGAWTSGTVSPGDAIQLAVEAEPVREFSIRLLGCEREQKSCEMIAEQLVVPSVYERLQTVAVISDSEVIAAGGPHGAQDGRLLFLQVEGDVVRTLDPIDALVGNRGHVDDDGVGIVGGVDRTIFRLDRDGTLIASSTVAFQVAGVSSGFDGTTMIVGKRGELIAIPKGTFDLRPVATPDYRDVEELDEAKIAVVREDLFLLYGPDAVLQLYDGAYREILDERIDAIAADENSFLAVAEAAAAVILFDRSTERWSSVGQLFLTARAKNAAAFGDGRFIVAGQAGVTGYYNGERLCPVISGVDRNIEDLDVAPSGRVIFGVGDVSENPFGVPVFLRFTILDE